MNYNKELEVAKQIALEAGDVMLHYFDTDQRVETKDDGTSVTIADKEINRLVISELERNFPDDGVIGEEESTSSYGMGRKWFCDPIDGTQAYIWGIPTAMFSLALVVDGRPVIGVAYDPFLKLLYYASVGGGSFCNDNAIHVSMQDTRSSTVAVKSDVRSISEGVDYVKNLIAANVRLASYSGAVHKYVMVAKGKFVGYPDERVNAHDVAASEVIVTEAGGKMTDFQGELLNYSRPFKGAVVSNGLVHDELIKMLNS